LRDRFLGDDKSRSYRSDDGFGATNPGSIPLGNTTRPYGRRT
jgi:hypothetical protein